MTKQTDGSFMLQVKSYYLRIKKKVTLAPAEPFPSWPGMVWPIELLE